MLKIIYQRTVRPTMEYSWATWSTTVNNNQQALASATHHSWNHQIYTYCLYGETRYSTTSRRQAKILLRAKSLPDHPRKIRLIGLTKNQLKRSSFVYETKQLDRMFAIELTIATTPMNITAITDLTENDLSTVETRLAVTQLDTGTQESEDKKRSITLAMIDAYYPSESWIHVYTDGPAIRAVEEQVSS